MENENKLPTAEGSPERLVGHLPITQLRIGMMVKVTHPEYSNEYPDPVEIYAIERHPKHGENISILDGGCMYDGWRAADLYIVEERFHGLCWKCDAKLDAKFNCTNADCALHVPNAKRSEPA